MATHMTPGKGLWRIEFEKMSTKIIFENAQT